ncbi:MAG: phosphoribosyltransferase family protein [Dehalococcoidia bacterium]|jgi:hypoxanthine phosphoribosyltransferase
MMNLWLRVKRLLKRSIRYCYSKVRSTPTGIAISRRLWRTYRWAEIGWQNSTGKYTFVTIEELVAWTNEWIKSFPINYDAIVGIPRSGLLVASLIAVKLGKPLTTPQLLAENQYWMSNRAETDREIKRILLVDDAVGFGDSFEQSKPYLAKIGDNISVTTAALIVDDTSKNMVDLYYKIIPFPHMYEWNMMHVKKGKLACDMDGVICEECTPAIDSDEESYSNWIRNARPYLIPAFEIDVIISNRLEKYRAATVEWLSKHGVQYKELLLWDIEFKEEREGKWAQNKVASILKTKPDIVWESGLDQASEIWKSTKIPTLCVDEMILFS